MTWLWLIPFGLIWCAFFVSGSLSSSINRENTWGDTYENATFAIFCAFAITFALMTAVAVFRATFQ